MERTLSSIPICFSNLSPEARVWVFQSERPLTPEEVAGINVSLQDYVASWASHGRSLAAAAGVLKDRFIVIAQDATQGSAASGCSIDNMTQHVQSLQSVHGINLLDRTSVYYQSGDEILQCQLNNLDQIHEDKEQVLDTMVYNTLIKTVGDFQDHWLVPIRDSWHKRFC